MILGCQRSSLCLYYITHTQTQAWRLSGDQYAIHPGDKPWISEMYGYSYGAAKADVWHIAAHGAMEYPEYELAGVFLCWCVFVLVYLCWCMCVGVCVQVEHVMWMEMRWERGR